MYLECEEIKIKSVNLAPIHGIDLWLRIACPGSVAGTGLVAYSWCHWGSKASSPRCPRRRHAAAFDCSCCCGPIWAPKNVSAPASIKGAPGHPQVNTI